MGDILIKKRRRRAGYRGHLSKLEKDINDCVNNFDKNNINHVSRLNALKNNFNEPPEFRLFFSRTWKIKKTRAISCTCLLSERIKV